MSRLFLGMKALDHFPFFPQVLPCMTARHEEPASLKLYSLLSLNLYLTFKLYKVGLYYKKIYINGKLKGNFNHPLKISD